MDAPSPSFSGFFKWNLLYNAETFFSCSFIPNRNMDKLIVCPYPLTSPWQRHNHPQVWQDFDFVEKFPHFHPVSGKLQNGYIFSFLLRLALFFFIFCIFFYFV